MRREFLRVGCQPLHTGWHPCLCRRAVTSMGCAPAVCRQSECFQGRRYVGNKARSAERDPIRTLLLFFFLQPFHADLVQVRGWGMKLKCTLERGLEGGGLASPSGA